MEFNMKNYNGSAVIDNLISKLESVGKWAQSVTKDQAVTIAKVLLNNGYTRKACDIFENENGSTASYCAGTGKFVLHVKNNTKQLTEA